MAWIELHDTLPDHDKVLDVSEALKMDKDMVVGKLVRLWTWALKNREDGIFRARDIPTIAEIMRYKGTPKSLVDALVRARLLDQAGDTYVIHDWDERVGMLLAKRETARAQNRARVQKHRSKKVGNASETENNAECNALHEHYEAPNEMQCNAATVPIPYLKDDEDDIDVDTQRGCAGAYARADDLDEWGVAYEDADRVVKAAFKASFGREATPAEVQHLSRIAVTNGKIPLIGAAIQRAADNGVTSVGAYVATIIRDWRFQEIDTEAELAEYEFLQANTRGKLSAIEPTEAFERMQKHREEKHRQRTGGGAHG